jgi:two-component system, OmpR family, response regulator
MSLPPTPAMHLLVVDDDRINLMLAEAACAALPGVRVSTATSGAEALSLAHDDPPQVLVIDLHLPDTDGYALLHSLRRDAALSGIPAYLCTADDSADLRQAAAAAGFAGCWGKPIDAQALRRELATLGLALAG